MAHFIVSRVNNTKKLKAEFACSVVLQVEFAKSIGEIDLSNLTDDFVEDVMLQSKPLQSILHAIRKRQRVSSLLTCQGEIMVSWNLHHDTTSLAQLVKEMHKI